MAGAGLGFVIRGGSGRCDSDSDSGSDSGSGSGSRRNGVWFYFGLVTDDAHSPGSGDNGWVVGRARPFGCLVR
jgi:hypothetical protein